MDKSTPYCTFLVDGHCFGIPGQQVREVFRAQPMTRVPLAPREVSGLINLRGQILTVIDLRRRLNLSDSPSSCRGTHVIVDTRDESICFWVDEMSDVQHLDLKQLESPPDTLRGIPRELITGVYQLADRLLLILNVARVVDVRQNVRI